MNISNSSSPFVLPISPTSQKIQDNLTSSLHTTYNFHNYLICIEFFNESEEMVGVSYFDFLNQEIHELGS